MHLQYVISTKLPIIHTEMQAIIMHAHVREKGTYAQISKLIPTGDGMEEGISNLI